MDQKLEKLLRELPELTKGKGVWQNRYHEFDVYEHTLKYVEFLKGMTSDPDMLVAGYFHDIAKPAVKKQKFLDGKPEYKSSGVPYHEFIGHETVGEEMVRKMPPRFFVDHSLDQERVAKLVGAHYLPMEHIKKMRQKKNFSQFARQYRALEKALDATGLSRSDVMTMFLADCLAKGKGCTDIEELKLAREVVLNKGNPDLLKSLYAMQAKVYGGKA